MGQYSYLLAPQRQAAAPPPPQKQPKQQAQQQAPAQPAVYVPEDLVGVQAYILWEQAGKPDGADFGVRARELLEGRLRAGESLQDVERSLREPQPQQAQQQQKQERKQERKQQQQQAPPPPPPPQAQAVVGQSMGMRSRNPLDLVNRSTAPLLSEKKRAVRTPLTPLLEAMQGDSSINWHRVRRGGRVGCWPALRWQAWLAPVYGRACSSTSNACTPGATLQAQRFCAASPPPPPRSAAVQAGQQDGAAGGCVTGGRQQPRLCCDRQHHHHAAGRWCVPRRRRVKAPSRACWLARQAAQQQQQEVQRWWHGGELSGGASWRPAWHQLFPGFSQHSPVAHPSSSRLQPCCTGA